MKIESIIKRPEGTSVELGGETYHFVQEQANGPHVAEVTNPDHIERLLAIPEGYRKVNEKKSAGKTGTGSEPLRDLPPDPSKPGNPNGNYDPTTRVLNTGAEVIARNVATPAGGIPQNSDSLPIQNEGTPGADRSVGDDHKDETDDGKESEGDDSADQNGDGQLSAEEQEREELALKYKDMYGRKPHHTWTAERIKAELAEGEV